MEFLNNMGLASRGNIENNIAQSEIHRSYYAYTMSIDLDRVGVDGDINIKKEEKAERVKILLDSMHYLYRDIKGRRENLSLASAMVSIPGTIGSFLQIDPEAHPVWYTFFRTFNYTSWLYIVIYLLLILAFNYFYVAIQYNPVEIANNLRRNNGSIPGFRPGKPTSDFITRTLNKITLIGAIFLAVVAVLPIILGNLTGLSIQLGGTSLLIVVGVALDTTRALDSFMTMRNHKGFLG